MNLKDVNYLHYELACLMLRLIRYVQVYTLDKVMPWDEPLECFFKACETLLKKRRAVTRIKDNLIKEFDQTKSRVQKRNRLRKAMNLLFNLVKKYIEDLEKGQNKFLSPVKEKLNYFARTLKLSAAESHLVLISFLTDIFNLSELEGIEEYNSYLDNIKALSRISGVSKSAIMNCISINSVLIGSGLFSCHRDRSALELFVIKPSFVEILLDARIKSHQIFQNYFAAQNKAALPIHCFDYLQTDIKIISAILGQNLLKKRKGVNILFYGEPGTGKTALAHSLLKSLGFERVALEAGEKRLGKYRLCQKVYEENKKLCLIFDEAEPILNTCYHYLSPHFQDKSDIIEVTDNLMTHYQCNMITTDTEISALTQAIQHFYDLRGRRLALPVRNLNFLFYGPPGSGKLELARHLGHELHKELLIKNASDLLDMYVGNTEKYIREAFEVAEEEDKILVLDEADSFFQKRNSATHQRQVSQVNEILNAMEGFRGVLICTTNFIDHFDPASLRRFAYKVKFDYLKIHQKVSIFNQLFVEMIQLPHKQTVANSLKSIPDLTIGDFTTVYKQAIFLPKITFSTIMSLLEKESRMKKGPHKRIGF